MKKWQWTAVSHSIESLYLLVSLIGILQLMQVMMPEPLRQLSILPREFGYGVVALLVLGSGSYLRDERFFSLALANPFVIAFLCCSFFWLLVMPVWSLLKRQRPQIAGLAPLYLLLLGTFVYKLPPWMSEAGGRYSMVLYLILNVVLLGFSIRGLRRSLSEGRSHVNVLGCGMHGRKPEATDASIERHASSSDSRNANVADSAVDSTTAAESDADHIIDLNRNKVPVE